MKNTSYLFYYNNLKQYQKLYIKIRYYKLCQKSIEFCKAYKDNKEELNELKDMLKKLKALLI